MVISFFATITQKGAGMQWLFEGNLLMYINILCFDAHTTYTIFCFGTIFIYFCLVRRTKMHYNCFVQKEILYE